MKKILIVCNEICSRKLFEEVIKRQITDILQIDTPHSSQKASELLKKNHDYDLIIMDEYMNGGYENVCILDTIQAINFPIQKVLIDMDITFSWNQIEDNKQLDFREKKRMLKIGEIPSDPEKMQKKIHSILK